MEEKNQKQNVTDDGKSTSYIYKLDSLKEKLGGNLTTGILCSVAPIPNFDRERAKRDKVELICGKDLLQLEARIKKLVNS